MINIDPSRRPPLYTFGLSVRNLFIRHFAFAEDLVVEAARSILEWYREVPLTYSVFSTERVTIADVIVIQYIVSFTQGRHHYNLFITAVQKYNSLVIEYTLWLLSDLELSSVYENEKLVKGISILYSHHIQRLGRNSLSRMNMMKILVASFKWFRKVFPKIQLTIN